MTQIANTLPGEGTFFIMRHRGNERVMLEVSEGKMVSISVEPADKPLRSAVQLDDAAPDRRASLIPGSGNC